MSVKRKQLPRVYSREELKKAAEEIAFETQHFRCYTELRKNPKLPGLSLAAYQAVGYTLLLHLRVLIDFFYKDPALDDCHVHHFRVLPGFETLFPANLHIYTEKTRDVSATLNKRMAHFTATRWEKTVKAWDYYEELAPTIEELITRFENALPDDIKVAYTRGYHRWETSHRSTL
jgi:hypothetical protein